MYDVLLDDGGDLFIDNGDVCIVDSVKQEIEIKLKWFFGEWIFNKNLGVDYYGELFIKKPNRSSVVNMITDEILSIKEVVDVNDIEILFDYKARKAHLSYKVVLDSYETLKGEFDICKNME